MKRIGDILIANGWIEPAILSRALATQKTSGQRLCSLLVIGGALSADDAACALAEQHGVAAALQRHLSGRDPAVAPLLSAALARACIALPIGRMGNGDVIVCVRDPAPALEAQLTRAMKVQVRVAVASAHQLEALVLETYGADEAADDPNEFEVDLSTGPILSLELDEDDEHIEPLSDEALADLGALELVDLDDSGVSKDESQTQVPVGKQRHSTLPSTTVVNDAPTFRAGTAPVVDAPSYRSSTAIVVDAPSQREPPGRAALAAAGIAIPRTQTPRRTGGDNEGIAVPRTQTPMQSGLVVGPPGRAALDAAGASVARTQTPNRSSLAAAAKSAMKSVADAESAAVAESLAAAAAAVTELSFDDEPAVITQSPLVEDLLTPEPVKAPAPPAEVLAPKPVLPAITPPRAEGMRPPPAALAALQRASSTATRIPNIPLRPIPSALAARSIPAPAPAPVAVAPVPEDIAIGTQLPAATLAVSARLAEALDAVAAAPKLDAVCDRVMMFAAKRWSAALLLDVEGMSATGRRGHGAQISDDLAQWIVMSLDEPSLLQAAFAFPEVATATPGGHGDVENRLQQLLGRARGPSAIAISVEGRPLLLLAVGDPDGDDEKTAAADLARLGDGAGAALTRLRGR